MSLDKALSNLGPRIADTGKLIGGLMYTDELKTKDRLFAALTKREDRIYNEGRDNLKAAQGGYKEVWKKSHSSWKVLADQYYKYKDSTGVEGELGAYQDSEMIKSMKAEMDQLWDIQESSKEQYLRSVGINYKRAEQPDVDMLTTSSGSGSTIDQLTDALLDNTPDEILRDAFSRSQENKDLDISGFVEDLQDLLKQDYERSQRALGVENLDPEYIKEQSQLSPELLAKARQLIRNKLIERGEAATTEHVGKTFSGARSPVTPLEGSVENIQDIGPYYGMGDPESGWGGYPGSDKRAHMGMGATGYLEDADKAVRDAEAGAQARAQNVTAQQPKGMISAAEQGIATTQASQRGPQEAYSDAKEIISTLLQQFPAQLAQQHFIEMVGELELNQIEMQAFQQAFQEMFGMSL